MINSIIWHFSGYYWLLMLIPTLRGITLKPLLNVWDFSTAWWTVFCHLSSMWIWRHISGWVCDTVAITPEARSEHRFCQSVLFSRRQPYRTVLSLAVTLLSTHMIWLWIAAAVNLTAAQWHLEHNTLQHVHVKKASHQFQNMQHLEKHPIVCCHKDSLVVFMKWCGNNISSVLRFTSKLIPTNCLFTSYHWKIHVLCLVQLNCRSAAVFPDLGSFSSENMSW